MAIKVHHLRPAPGAKQTKHRVGRGEAGKGGKTAGRGTKGTGARKNVPENFEGGFQNPFRVSYQVVNISRIADLFPAGGAVGVDDLVKAGAVRDGQLVKVLGDGDITVKLEVTADKFSASAKEKIEKAGGSVTVQ